MTTLNNRHLLILGIMLSLFPSEGQPMQTRLRILRLQSFLGEQLSERHLSELRINHNLISEIEEFKEKIKESNLTINAYMDVRLLDRELYVKTPADVLMRILCLNNRVDNLLTPITQNEIKAGQRLFQLGRRDFSREDLNAMIYLQTNNAGEGQLGNPLPEPTLSQIEAAKSLIGLSFLPFTQEDLDTTEHIQTDPGNALGGSIPNPTQAEIFAAKMLKQQNGTFSIEALHNQVRTTIREHLRPLARDSKIQEIRHADRRYVEKDVEADQLICTTPEVLHQQLWNDYEAFKSETVPSSENIGNGLAERQQLARRLFQ